MEKARIYQLIEIIRRVKTAEMAKLKFISNFGLSIEARKFILCEIYFCPNTIIQDKLAELSNMDLIQLL